MILIHRLERSLSKLLVYYRILLHRYNNAAAIAFKVFLPVRFIDPGAMISLFCDVLEDILDDKDDME